MARHALSIAAALAVVPAVVLTPAAPAHAVATQSVRGVYQRVAVHGPDGVEHARDSVRDLLVVGSRALALRLPRGVALRPGAEAVVRGTVTGTTLSAIDAAETSEPAPTSPPDGAAYRTRVLVVLAAWTAPDATSPAAAAQQILADGDAWRREVSNGLRGFTGAVTPWLTIAGPTDGLCFTNHRETMAQAKAAAQAAGFDPSAYERVVLYHPRSEHPDCAGYGGWAYQPGTEVWLNGRMTRAAAMHELGHNDGLWHAGVLRCSQDGRPVVLSATCTPVDYSDITDAMGSAGFAGHFSVTQKSRLGWLGSRSVTLAAGQSTVLSPVEEAGTSVIAGVINVSSGRRYWLATRRAIGADAQLPAGVLNGLLVRVDDASVSPSPLLLDLTPDGTHVDAALPAGGRWTTPEGLVIRTAAHERGLAVSVSTVTAPGPPAAVGATPGDGSATVVWSPPDDDGGDAITSYAVTVGATTVTAAPSARSVAVTGLANGTSYPVSVVARTSAGTGAPTSTSVVPADRTAPAAPTSVRVSSKQTSATLTWQNPPDADFAGVVVVMRVGTTAPTSPTDGDVVYSGTGTSASVSGLTRGTTYTFAVFARDEVPNWSAGAVPTRGGR